MISLATVVDFECQASSFHFFFFLFFFYLFNNYCVVVTL